MENHLCMCAGACAGAGAAAGAGASAGAAAGAAAGAGAGSGVHVKRVNSEPAFLKMATLGVKQSLAPSLQVTDALIDESPW